ncbi:MAG: hypothetical protein F6K11_23095 [Leptolyngbya sp. SIO3F4]|nr:hypothetical protein [Leptolyngbya sp. SIO3F4]
METLSREITAEAPSPKRSKRIMDIVKLTGMDEGDPLYSVMEALDAFYTLIETVPLELVTERETISIQLGKVIVLTESFISVAEDLQRNLDTSTPRAYQRKGASIKQVAISIALALVIGAMVGRPILRATLSGLCTTLQGFCEVEQR